uniref:Helix-turn-helix domain-containing protein n=1 Tax=Candidatus Kentrum eta TaxID=2126337 RepID=A0A450VKV3_9GAMM|nr:MAG: Helix-turn-helix domain-containing protein [Candidatus Kentron sp. H]
MSRYTQLTREQRYRIYILEKVVQTQTQTQTEIASTPGVHKSTISRELCRNRGGKGLWAQAGP